MKEETVEVKVLCAWCGKKLGEVEVSCKFEGVQSHGICRECAEDMKRSFKQLTVS